MNSSLTQEKESEGSTDNLLHKSALYKEFEAERQEILKHKWIESEKAGRDVGFERAFLDWIVKYRAGWRRHRKGIHPPQS